MSGPWKSLRVVVNRYPVLRGMVTYSFLLPASNITQQLLDPNRSKYNPWETVRFGVYGCFIMAPSLYGWIRLASVIVKSNTLKWAVLKAYTEQFVWAPFAYIQFYLSINLLEGRPWEQCVQQCRDKIPETWKVGFCVWPVVQTVNFWLVPLKHRVPFVAFFSYMWNTFLSFMHHKQTKKHSTQDL